MQKLKHQRCENILIKLLLLIGVFFSFHGFSADESLEGNIVISDSYANDFDGDLTIGYNIETYYTGSGSSRSYAGFTGTFTGITDGACNTLSLLFNQKLCSSASIKIKRPKANSDGELELFNGGEYTINSSSQQYATILTNSETLFDNHSCQGLKTGGCFYNTPEMTATGECKNLNACQICAGNSISIEYICKDNTTIASEETITVDPSSGMETTTYTFPVRKIFAIQEGSSLITDTTFRSDIKLPAITITESDAPITCENSNIARDLIDDSEKLALNSACASPSTTDNCQREAKKLMSSTLRKMSENRLDNTKANFFFKHSNISENRAARLRPPVQALSFLLFKYNREDGQSFDIYDLENNSSNRTSTVSTDERRYKKKYTASCDSTCAQSLALFPTLYGGTYTSPTELNNNCSRVYKGMNIGVRSCLTEEVVSAVTMGEAIGEKSAINNSLTCEAARSGQIEDITGEEFPEDSGGEILFDSNGVPIYTNCHEATESGPAKVNLTNTAGTSINEVLVHCELGNDGLGYLDVVKTFHLPGIDLDTYKNYFFISNDASAIRVTVQTNSEGTKGIVVQNAGGSSLTFKEGFHIVQTTQKFSNVKLEYRMQGATTSAYPRCGNSGWVPLNGPGYNGGNSTYLSPCPVGKTCIQGNATASQDAPISATFEANNITDTNLLTFSGTGGYAMTGSVVESCMRDNLIPINESATFITNLQIHHFDWSTYSCLNPNTIGYNSTNCDTTSGAKTAANCLISCNNSLGYYQTGNISATCSATNAKFVFSGCRKFNSIGEFISSTSDLFLDANYGVTTSGSTVSNWVSKTNAKDLYAQLNLTSGTVQYNTSNSAFNNNPTVKVNAGQLTDSTYTGLQNSNNFTRIVVFSNDNVSTSNAVAISNGNYGSIQRYSATSLYSYVGATPRAQIASFFTSADMAKPMVLTHRFDSSQSTNDTKNTVRKNGEGVSGATYYSTLAPVPSGVGFQVGHSSAPWYGDIAEVIIFNRALSDTEISQIENYLIEKYRAIPFCTIPEDSTGYDTTNCSSLTGNIKPAECSISCSSGYESSVVSPINVTCGDDGIFTFSGCFAEGTAPTALFFEDFEYKTEAGALNTNFQNDSVFQSRWNVYKDANEGNIDLITQDGTQMLRSFRASGTHWGAGVATKMQFNPGVKIKYRHHVASHYTNGTSHEGLFIYTGNRTNAAYYGYPGTGDNLGNISTYMYGGARFYTGGIFGNGTNYELLPTSTLPLILDYTVDINVDLSWRVQIDFPAQPSIPSFVRTGNLTVSELSNFYLEFYSGDYSNYYSYFDNILVIDTSIDCTLADVDTTGYNVSSCPSDSLFQASDCSALACDNSAGYYQNSQPPALSCAREGAKFTISGCEYFGSVEEILAKNTLHLDPSSGVSIDGSNLVTSWQSKNDKDGSSTTLSRAISSGPELVTQDGIKFLKFLGDGTESLSNDSFAGQQAQEKFTRILVYKPETASSMLLYDNASGYDGHINNGTYYSQTTDGSSYNSGSFSTDIVNNMNVQFTEFDSSGATNADKVKVRLNGETKNITINSTTIPSVSGVGFNLGNWKGTTKYWFQGLVGEIIYLPTVLPEAVRNKVEIYLLKKYGIIKTCTTPTIAGYDTINCDSSDGALSSSECSISCSTGYSTHSSLTTPQALCETNNSTFNFYGCYSDSAPTNGDEIAEAYIKTNNVLHLEASHGTFFDNSNMLRTWDSHPDKNNKIHRLSGMYANGGATQANFDSATYLEFDSYLDKINNSTFNGLINKDEFTRINVFVPYSTSANIIGYDASGFATYLLSNAIYSRANISLSQTIYANGASALLNSASVHSTRLDNTASDQLLKMKQNLNGNSLTNVGGTGTLTAAESTLGVTIGGWTSTAYSWNGLIGEIIYFDTQISDELLGYIEIYLMKKYGLIKFCSIPDTSAGAAAEAYSISCNNPENGLYSTDNCTFSCATGFTQFTNYEFNCNTNGEEFTYFGCGVQGEVQSPENTVTDQFAIQYSDYTKYFESSYSVLSLPDPNRLRDGWYVNIKAVNGPIYVYPSYNTNTTLTAPKIDTSYDQIILTKPNSQVKLTYQSGNWISTIISGETSHTVIKNDAPTNCPNGYSAIHGNYLLETDGFCVHKEGNSVTGTISTLLDTWDINCASVVNENGGGTAAVITDKQFSTMMFDSVYYYKDSLSSFRSQFNNADSSCKGTPSTNDNEITLISGDTVKIHHSSPGAGYCGCSNGLRPECQNYYQHASRELLSWDGRYQQIDFNLNSCDSNYNNINTINPNFTNHILINSSGAIQSTFDIENYYYQDLSVAGCDMNNFMSFSGLQSTTSNSTIKFLNGISTFYTSSTTTNFAPIYSKSFGSYSSSGIGSLNIGVEPLTNSFTGKVRCAYTPGEFSCELPVSTTGYNTSNCNATSENKLPISNCSLSCESGYSQIGSMAPTAKCTVENGSQEGVFSFSGCVPDAMVDNPDSISSCENASEEGVYLIDLISSTGNVIEDVKVFCSIDNTGSKSIDVVKTMALAEVDGTESIVGSYFFETNNTSTVVVSSEINSSGKTGILVRNLGENIATNYDYTTGFHLSKTNQIYNQVSIDYSMQGARETDICATTGWVPLNGPGFEGGYASYQSPSLPGFTSIQGKAQLDRDSAIHATYSNTNVLSTQILSFSGTGKDSNTVYSCSESVDIPRVDGVAKTSTFFKKLNINDNQTKHCTIPTMPSNMILNCGTENIDGLYKTGQCSLSCDSGYYLYQPNLSCDVDQSDFSIEGFCVTQSTLDEDVETLIFEPFDDANNYFNEWTQTLTGSAALYTPVPYTSDPNFSSAYACVSSSVYPSTSTTQCKIETINTIPDPTLNPVNIDFIVRNLTAYNGPNATFFFEIIDANSVVSSISWKNYGNYMGFNTATGMFASITGFNSPSSSAFAAKPMQFTTRFFQNGLINIGIESHDKTAKTTATANWSDYQPPFKVRFTFQHYNFWTCTNTNIIDEINIYKAIDPSILTGPF